MLLWASVILKLHIPACDCGTLSGHAPFVSGYAGKDEENEVDDSENGMSVNVTADGLFLVTTDSKQRYSQDQG